MTLALASGRLATFRHGVHPAERKDATSGLAVERMPFVPRYVLPLSQHIGAPAKAIVERGQTVRRGQMVAAPGGFVSVALHAPVDGTVAAIDNRLHPNGQLMTSIVIDTDPMASQREVVAPLPLAADAAPDDVVQRIQDAGIVGLGGAAFPCHVKLKVPAGKKVRFAILNGCECEPYLTCDHRVMVEQTAKVVNGLRLIMRTTGAERAYIGVEANKPDAIELLSRSAQTEGDIEIVPLAVKYPEGAEKMLIDAILRREVPTGKIPLDLEVLVQNVGTAAALADLMLDGRPLIERVVTVTGPGITRPANVMVPIGTPVQAVIDHCGGLTDRAQLVILGGPMMGQAQKSLDVPVIKGTSGILVLDEHPQRIEEAPCIRCGRCLEACPMFLNPSRLAQLARYERVDDLEAAHLTSCFECASCSFSCPSHIPLVQLIRVGKSLLRGRKSP